MHDRISVPLLDDGNQSQIMHLMVASIRHRGIAVDAVMPGPKSNYIQEWFLEFNSEAEKLQFLISVGDFKDFVSTAKMSISYARNRPYDPDFSQTWWDW
jgi:hypothetical protein